MQRVAKKKMAVYNDDDVVFCMERVYVNFFHFSLFLFLLLLFFFFWKIRSQDENPHERVLSIFDFFKG